jgi:hypothetical protein
MAGSTVTTRGQSNCTLTYVRSGAGYLLQTRARGISYAWDVIATESHARENRAFYPHQRALGMFTVTFELIGYAEQKPVMDWLRAYIGSSSGVSQNSVAVSVPAYGFWRLGVPIDGVIDEDHTGSNVFLPAVTFASVTDPLDTTTFTGTGNSVSQPDYGITQKDDAAQFFYPGSVAVNDPNASGNSFYDNPANQPVVPDIPLAPGTITGPQPSPGVNRPF